MLILCLTAVLLQLVTAQNNHLLNAKLIPGPPDSCQSREQRAAVDTAIQSIHQTRDEVLSTLQSQCGSIFWTRVAYLNMTDPSQQCPSSWRLYSANGIRACGRQVILATTGGCYSQSYTTQLSYRRVCGRIIGYQIGSTNVFHDQQLSIDEPYVDGISVTYGEPRKHIWTFAGGISETIVAAFPNLACPCALNGTGIQPQQPPAFVGDSYFCESANPLNTHENTKLMFFDIHMIHSGMVKDVKVSVALAPTHLLGSVSCCPMSPMMTSRCEFVQINKLTMKMLPLDCLRYTCSDTKHSLINLYGCYNVNV